MICFLINPSNFRLLHRQQKTTSEHDAETIYTRNRWSSTDTDPCAVFPLLDDVAVSLVVIVYLSPTFSQLSFPFFSLLVHTQTQSMSYVGERSHKIDYRICTHKEQSPPNWSAQNIIFIFKKCFKHFGKKKKQVVKKVTEENLFIEYSSMVYIYYLANRPANMNWWFLSCAVYVLPSWMAIEDGVFLFILSSMEISKTPCAGDSWTGAEIVLLLFQNWFPFASRSKRRG